MKKSFFILLLGLGVINAEISQRIIDFEVDTNVEISFDELFSDYDIEWARISVLECPSNCEIWLYSNLDSFNEGGGYWFKSNSAVCFQYDCVAN